MPGLDYNILNKKPIEERNGIKFQDLAVQTINPEIRISGSVLVVNKYYVARPDLISLAVYGDDKYADIICKVNGISNPFELNENDILIIPDIETVMDLTSVGVENSVFIDNSKNSNSPMLNQNTIDDMQKDINSLRSPNEQTKGMRNLIIDDEHGLLLY